MPKIMAPSKQVAAVSLKQLVFVTYVCRSIHTRASIDDHAESNVRISS
jgi:hypothetical protein